MSALRPPAAPPPSPPVSGLAWRAATLADAPALLELMHAFYAEEGIEFDGATQGRALDALLADPALGDVFLLDTTGTPAGADEGRAPPLGHLVLTRGHSLEFGGRFLLIDELYLAPGIRGRGEGRRALELAAARAGQTGAGALRLEVSRKNARARAAYARAGFATENRHLLTLRAGANGAYPFFPHTAPAP